MTHSPIRWVLLTLVLSVFWPWKVSLADVVFSQFATLSEQAAHSDAIALVERVSVDEQEKTTKFVVRYVAGVKSGEPKPDETLVVKWPYKNRENGLQLLFANKAMDGRLEWSRGAFTNTEPGSEALWKYLLAAPKPDVAAIQRLEYFLKFLESDDPAIANDVLFELDSAFIKDLVASAPKLPRDKLRASLKNPATPPARRQLCAELLGFCGDQSDAEFFLAHIREPSDKFRVETDSYVIAYLWLTGEQGLTILEELKLRSSNFNFSECYAVMQALRFMERCGQDRIEKARLRQAMRWLLDCPELADLVINDLSRWKDWSVQDRLMKLYNEPNYSVPSTKRSIVRYFLACGQVPAVSQREEPREIPPHAVKARIHLEELRQLDPKTVKEAERFFRLLVEPSAVLPSAPPAAPSPDYPRRGRAAYGWPYFGC